MTPSGMQRLVLRDEEDKYQGWKLLVLRDGGDWYPGMPGVGTQ